MARIRTIKPELPHSESMGRVSRDARLLFILLWTLADDSGTLRGNSRMLASLLFPYDDDAPEKIGGWMKELIKEECIAVYDHEGATYVYVRNWLRHQKIDKPSASKLPQWSGDSRKFSKRREKSLRTGTGTGTRKGPGPGEGPGTDSSEPPSATPELVVMTFPVVGDPDVAEWPLYQSKIDQYAETYPGVDVLAACRKARQWCIDNVTKRKTPKGMLRFLNAWMERRQNEDPKVRARPGDTLSANQSAVAEFLERKASGQTLFDGVVDGEQ